MGESRNTELSTTEVLEFLSEWRTTKEIKEKFNLSTTRWHNLKTFLLKGRFIEKIRGNYLEKSKTNSSYLYRAI